MRFSSPSCAPFDVISSPLENPVSRTPIVQDICDALDARHDAVEAWLANERGKSPPHIYTSVDIRHSGLKLAPVDTNLFPAGFNNLSQAGGGRAVEQFRDFLASRYPDTKRILIIPENHTRNLAYLDNLHRLAKLLEEAGAEVRIGSLTAEAGTPLQLTSLSGHAVEELPIARKGDRLVAEDGFTPDLIVANNDFTPGVPEILKKLSQPIVPPATLGWHRRRKTIHFTAYNKLAERFAEVIGIDPWLISTQFHRCGMVDFGERAGIECVALGVERVLHAVRRKYEEHGIAEEPYVFIKADSGTYGMGIMTARAGDDLFAMNKKVRNKMDVIKEGVQNSEVIIQEGVPTVDRVDGQSAEPMIYLVDGVPVGGAWRVNDQRDQFGNLNATGMRFTGMCDESERDSAREKVRSCHFRVFGMVAQLAAFAAAQEEY